MNRNIFTGLLILLAASSCGKKSRLEKADWLLGRWENKSEHDCFSETWTKNGDNEYVAATYMVSRKDTLFEEHTELKETGKTLECAITIQDQNHAKPVVFKMTKQDDNSIVFENPKHDFPQVISYTNKVDSLIVVISGKQKGKFAKERFVMAKVK